MHEVFSFPAFQLCIPPPATGILIAGSTHRSDFCRRRSKVEKLRLIDKDQKVRVVTTTTSQDHKDEGRHKPGAERAIAGVLSHGNYLFDVCEEDVCDGFVVRSSQSDTAMGALETAAVRNPMDLLRFI